MVRQSDGDWWDLDWCASFSGAPVWLLHTLSPCLFEAGAAGTLLLVLLGVLLWQRGTFHEVQATMSAGRRSKFTTGSEGIHIGCAAALASMRLIHLVSAAFILKHRAPYHLFFNASLALIWLTAMIVQRYASRAHLLFDLRPLSGTAALVSAFGMYSNVQIYVAGPQQYGIPLTYIKSMIWTQLLELVLACGLVFLDTRRLSGQPIGRSAIAEARRSGYSPLGENGAVSGDVEAGVTEEPRTWISLLSDACVYVWPQKVSLQIRALFCLLLLVVMRVLNIAVPILYKKVVDTLSDAGKLGPDEFASLRDLLWPWIILYLVAVFFQGGGGGGITGFINNLRSVLWYPVSQDAYRRISLRVFDHVLDLSLSYHLKKKTGEVTKLVDRGTNAMQNILSTIFFSILPQMFDVLAAATYLSQALDPTIAIIVFVTVGCYIPLTIYITEWRGSLRREMNRTDQIMGARATDALLNYETVKHCTNEAYESEQYSIAIVNYQKAEWKSMWSMNALNIFQSFIMFLGIASGLLVCAKGVQNKTLTVGDSVLFLSMLGQLYGPLNWFGSYYRTIQQYMIDMENLLELLSKDPGVADRPGAQELVVSKGEVAFEDVYFHYEAKAPLLKNVSFLALGGTTIAFVGATGSGKSTLTRLLFRFYDVNAGSVRVDRQDIRDVTQTSLRRAIAMVPQDTVLFNDTILHNIRYGNIHASDAEVFAAAEAACIHETITTRFPKGYDTVVGERGLRLSGGEKQRVAFARALLKNSPILVLDEATSALDSITEKKIQSALEARNASRTTLIVAHRLSTISDAHTIVVMAHGVVAETGSHAQLLGLKGLYSELWQKQLHQEETVDATLSTTVSASNSTADLSSSVGRGGHGHGHH